MAQEKFKQRNRDKSSGNVAPSAHNIGITLLSALALLKTHYRTVPKNNDGKPSSFDKGLFYLLYLWLTQRLDNCHHLADIPNLSILSSNAHCTANSLRKIRMNNITWVEYALTYPRKQTIQWQPMPERFNHWFTHALQYSQDWTLNTQEKRQFLNFLHKKWHTPTKLIGLHRARRDIFFRYFHHCINNDPQLPVPAKFALIEHLHHRCAISYQKLTNEQIRHDIFHAQNRYLSRISQALQSQDLLHYLDTPKCGSNTLINLLHKDLEKCDYLTRSGTILSYRMHYTKTDRPMIPEPVISIGSVRSLDIDHVRHFFAYLQKQAYSYAKNQKRLEDKRAYFNFRSSQLSLLFIMLTGVRPTHSISIKKEHLFFQEAIVIDKGRARNIWLSDEFYQALLVHQTLQEQYQKYFPDIKNNEYSWFLIERDKLTSGLNAKYLRLFMNHYWKEAGLPGLTVPYHLRHTFAQHALMSKSRLSTHEVDTLMGHSEFGEHLGSEHRFPIMQERLKHHLNRIPTFLQLPPFTILRGHRHG